MANMMNLDPLVSSIKSRLPSLEELQHLPWMSLISKYMNVVVCVGLVLVGIYRAKRSYDEAQKLPKHAAVPAPDFPTITELRNFDWEKAEPAKLRPFRSKYHRTMADASVLESLDPNDLFLMDKTYRDRIMSRRHTIQQDTGTVIGINDDSRVREAISEFYSFALGTYLPLRYPRMFQCHHTEFEGGQESMLQNQITGELVQTRGSKPPIGNTPTRVMLANLGKHLDEDFLFLLPARYEKPGNAKYVLEAFETCFPSPGFSPKDKLGKVLKDIQGPVAGHGGKLEASMDRFLNKLEVGKYVVRIVWSISMTGDLSASADKGEEGMGEFSGKLDPDETHIRCERQTLHRLPRSKAIVFAVKTYMYPLRQIKEGGKAGEVVRGGSAEDLAQAIDDLRDGVLPETNLYVGGVEWGNAIKEYLRR